VATVPADDETAGGISPVVSAGPTGRRRRPTGEPPPLPHHVERGTGFSLLAVAAVLALCAAMAFDPVLRAVTALDTTVLQVLARLRTGPGTDLAEAVAGLGSEPALRAVGWATLAVIVVTRRWRHLVGYVAIAATTTLVVDELALAVGRPRPTGVVILGSWDGYSFPSRPVAATALVLVAGLLTVVPAGRRRAWAAMGVAVLVTMVAVSRLYLAVDHPSDVLAAVVLGGLFPLAAFRLFTPEDAFPVTYRRASGAHLELSAARHQAIVRALDQQLGLAVESVELFGLAGSAGSTPLRLGIRRPDGARSDLFGKLYAVNHLRSDRWYKLGRMVLYGRLEDEKPFSTVRRLVEYEDHLLRLLRDAGLPTPTPHGFVEITPEREYLLVMEFFDGAHELGAEPIGVSEIDSGLRVVRKLWEAGVAHRDIKPSNLLVRDGQVLLIDVAFATVRPTPWRQAVDLANMMLVLALCSSAEEVYQRALLQFADDDIAEAFAASRSVTLPTQLRARLRTEAPGLMAELRALAPRREPVAIQLWNVRRVLVTVALVAALLVTAGLVATVAQLAGLA
jgi:tRNA A-37 threonylcarbamoyl transferase component Bud32/membrane-associated phospholipid phosphatase